MPGKVLSSRADDAELVDELQVMVYTMHEMLGIDEDPEDEQYDLMLQLDDAIMRLSEARDVDRTHIAMLSMDLIQMSLRASLIADDLVTASRILEAMAKPANGNPFAKALMAMRREAVPTVKTIGAGVDLEFTYSEQQLETALRTAIDEYIHETAVSAM